MSGAGELRTDRLLLRRFTPDDVDLLVALDGDPAVMRYLTGHPTPRVEVAGRALPRYLAASQRSAGLGYWAGTSRLTGDFVGTFMLPAIDDAGSEAELGYRLRSSVWGRGLATEGAKALLHRAFSDYGVQRVVARTMTVNAASRRVMEKLGLTYVRTFHQDWPDVVAGAEHGDVEYVVTRQEWLTRHP